MKRSRRALLLSEVSRALWAATLVTIPVTSFRYFPAGEGTYVRPLAILPLSALLLVMGIRALQRDVELPRAASLSPLAAFLLIVVIASAMGVLFDPIPMRGQDALGRVLRAWITIFMGIGFFIGASWMNRDESALRFSVKWLMIGFAADVLWSGLQAATFYLHLLPKPLVTHWQRLFSLRELIRTNRISGMAYEPSWLAGQIATIYLPWLFAGALTRVRVLRFRWLEFALLVAATVMVLATFSRGGILTVAVSVGFVVLFAARPELRSAWRWFTGARSSLIAMAIRIGVVVAALLALGGAGFWLAQKGYVSRLWESRAENLAEFLVQNSAGARGAYVASAVATYQDHPWTGVGPGAAGLYLYSRLPDWAMTSVPEIARQLSPESNLYPNPKNLYLRLLAEAGLPGLLAFTAFSLVLLAESLQALRRGTAGWRYLGLAGLCTWFAVLLFNLTQDSFAAPNIWLNLGIVSGLIGAAAKAGDAVAETAIAGRAVASAAPRLARRSR
jgi:O-antigen ligase